MRQQTQRNQTLLHKSSKWLAKPLILGLADNLRNLRVREFTSKAFKENTFSGPDGDVPWAFDLEATYNLPEGNDPEQHTLSLKLTHASLGVSRALVIKKLATPSCCDNRLSTYCTEFCLVQSHHPNTVRHLNWLLMLTHK